MTEERVELSTTELAGLCATVCAAASGLGVFFASGHAPWERLVGIFFISVAVATFLLALPATARSLLRAARVRSKAVSPGAMAPAHTRPVLTDAATKLPIGSPELEDDRSAEGGGPLLHAATADMEHVVAPPAESDDHPQRDDAFDTQPCENLDQQHRPSRRPLRFLYRALRFTLIRIIPATIGICVILFIGSACIYYISLSPKHPFTVIRATGNASVTRVAFSPDGALLVAISCTGDCLNGNGSDQVDMWNLATKQMMPVFTYPGQNEADSSNEMVDTTPLLTFNPDGSSLATADFDGSVVYLIASAHFGVKVTILSIPDAIRVERMAFSPDGRALVITNDKGNAYLWNLATKYIEATFTSPSREDDLASAAFSSQKAIAALGEGNNHMYIWNFAAGTSFAMPHISYDGLSPIDIDARGQTLAIGRYYSEVQLVNLDTGMAYATLNDPTNSDLSTGQFGVTHVALSADGKLLAVTDLGGNIYLWNTAAKRLVGTLPLGPTSFRDYLDENSPEPETLAFSPDDKTLATGDTDGNVYLWDLSWLRT